jgi:hypothetical protein
MPAIVTLSHDGRIIAVYDASSRWLSTDLRRARRFHTYRPARYYLRRCQRRFPRGNFNITIGQGTLRAAAS